MIELRYLLRRGSFVLQWRKVIDTRYVVRYAPDGVDYMAPENVYGPWEDVPVVDLVEDDE